MTKEYHIGWLRVNDLTRLATAHGAEGKSVLHQSHARAQHTPGGFSPGEELLILGVY